MRTLSPSDADALAALAASLRTIEVGMLTTVRTTGELVSRPLATQQVTSDGGLLRFLVSLGSSKTADIARQPLVNVAYASRDRNTYVSVSGEARINRDPGAKKALWSEAMNAFFPGGEDDPDLVVLEVITHTIEAWEGPDSWLKKAVGFLIAQTTGDVGALGRKTHVDLRRPPSSPAFPRRES